MKGTRRWLCWVMLAVAMAAAAHASAQNTSKNSAQNRKKSPPSAAQSSAAAKSNASAQRQRELQAEQRQLQGRLAALKKQLADAEASHSEASDALRESEASISAVNRRLRELATSRKSVERQIAALQERSRVAAARQSDQERQLGLILRSQYVMAQESPWTRLVNGDDPQRLGRDLVYFDYIARARADAIGALQARRAELAALELESRDKQRELADIAADERSNRSQLVKEQTARRQTLDSLSRKINEQRASIATLERDERRLGSLIDELTKLLAEQARREAARREAERRQREQQQQRQQARRESPPRTAPSTPSREREIDPPADAKFAQLRGKLPLPVQGEIAARFGAARRTEAGVDAPTWKGLFIRAPQGSEVRAVADGRVVYADWLRGFGNLLILDHGEGFLSVYGNNETLLANVGERVAAREAIATVGNTGGNSDTGLYFELRFQGRPFDPLRWAAAR